MAEKEKMEKQELEKVAGGANLSEEFAKFGLQIVTVTRTCRKCGKEYETFDSGMLSTFMVDNLGADRYMYYYDLCGDCAKKYPYQGLGERFANGFVVKNGKIVTQKND